MNESKIKEHLAQIGLNPLEQDCFVELVKRSPQRASELSKRLSVPKATVLSALARLSDQLGLVTRAKKKNSFLFLVEDVSVLEAYVSRQIANFEKQKAAIAPFVPELRSMQNIDTAKPKLYYFEGKEGMRKALLRVLDEADEIIGYGSNEDDLKYLPNIYPAYYDQRVQKKIHVKAIIPATQFNIEETKKNERRHLRATHLIPEEWKYPIQVNIYKNTSVFYSCEENFTLMIKSKPIAECLKKIFELAYEKAGEYDRELRAS